MAPKRVVAVILGAGASRGVKYSVGRMPIESPLDFDFFDLLQRLAPRPGDQQAVEDTLRLVRELPYDCWRSLERAFYTLHLNAVMQSKLEPGTERRTPDNVVQLFVQVLQAVLRDAHGSHFCIHHRELVQRLWQDDAILSFNYDFVIERALEHLANNLRQSPCVQPWLYGWGNPPEYSTIPTVYKLHGSLDWVVNEDGTIDVVPLSANPGYAASDYKVPPIILPYWDKPVHEKPWADLWKKAFDHLKRTQDLLVWGYSLPASDIKTEYLFKLADESNSIEHLCVIDPSEGTQRRWRTLFPGAKYWQFRSFDEFRQSPPRWWTDRHENCINESA